MTKAYGRVFSNGEPLLYSPDSDFAAVVYVDPVNGSDLSDGTTEARALATLEEVYRQYPLLTLGGASVIVNILNSSDEVVELVTNAVVVGGHALGSPTYAYRGPAMILAELATGESAGATLDLDATPCVDVGKRTRFDFTTAAPGWTANDLRGLYIRVTRGADQILWELPIAENDSDQIFVDCLGITTNVLTTDTVEIVRPAVRITGPDAAINAYTIVGIGGAAGAIGTVAGGLGGCVFERLEMGGIPAALGCEGLSFDRCLFGSFYFNGGSAGLVNCAARGAGEIVWCCGSFDSAPTPRGTVTTGTPKVGLTSYEVPLKIGTEHRAGVYRAWEHLSVYTVVGVAAVNGAVTVTGPGSMLVMEANKLLGGASNTTTPALWARLGGYAKINGGVWATLTGSAGSTAIGTAAAVAYGAGVGALEEVAGYNGHLQVATQAAIISTRAS